MKMINRNRTNKSIHFLMVCFLSQILTLKIQAQEFIIGVEDVSYYPLYEFKSNRDTYSKELLNSFAASKGYKFTYILLPIKRFERWLLQKKIDFKYPDNSRWYSNPSLKEQFTFSESTIKLVAGTTVLKSSLKKNKSDFSGNLFCLIQKVQKTQKNT